MELRSDVPFASLLPAKGDAGAAHVTLTASATRFGEPSRWLYTERFEETLEPWRAVGVSEGGYLVRLFGLADFFLEQGTGAARVFVEPGAPGGVIEPLFLEQALPLWWSLLGRPCLHASAVAWGEGESARAIAFAGRSQSGKSTLATSLAGGEARALLADDCLVMELELELARERVIAHPSHRAVRLLSDSAQALLASAAAGEPSLDGGKRRVHLRAAERSLPLARIYMIEPVLDPDGAPRISRLRPRDAVACLATHLFRIDPEDHASLAAELSLLERITTHSVVARLAVPRRFDALDDVRAAIEADLDQDG